MNIRVKHSEDICIEILIIYELYTVSIRSCKYCMSKCFGQICLLTGKCSNTFMVSHIPSSTTKRVYMTNMNNNMLQKTMWLIDIILIGFLLFLAT